MCKAVFFILTDCISVVEIVSAYITNENFVIFGLDSFDSNEMLSTKIQSHVELVLSDPRFEDCVAISIINKGFLGSDTVIQKIMHQCSGDIIIFQQHPVMRSDAVGMMEKDLVSGHIVILDNILSLNGYTKNYLTTNLGALHKIPISKSIRSSDYYYIDNLNITDDVIKYVNQGDAPFVLINGMFIDSILTFTYIYHKKMYGIRNYDKF